MIFSDGIIFVDGLEETAAYQMLLLVQVEKQEEHLLSRNTCPST
jgi:hypothetical protein